MTDMMLSGLPYGRAVSVAMSFESAIDRVKELLRDEGFGVLCDIDVAATMREKIGVSFRPYRILGACNPHLAHRALTNEPHVGLLLPCNVVVQEAEGATIVSAVDALEMLKVVGNEALSDLGKDANERLSRVLDRIAGSHVPGAMRNR